MSDEMTQVSIRLPRAFLASIPGNRAAAIRERMDTWEQLKTLVEAVHRQRVEATLLSDTVDQQGRKIDALVEVVTAQRQEIATLKQELLAPKKQSGIIKQLLRGDG